MEGFGLCDRTLYAVVQFGLKLKNYNQHRSMYSLSRRNIKRNQSLEFIYESLFRQ